MSTEKINQFKGSEHIEVKKSAKANLEQNKTIWVLIGFVMVFSVLFVAFEWTTFEDKEERIIATTPPPPIEEPEVLKEIQIQVKNITPPPPAAQKPTEVIEIIKELSATYNRTRDPEDYLRLLMSNPCGFRLTAGMTTNYRQLKTIYAQRRTHRLPEWRTFCAWIETLPYAKEFITG